MSNKLETFISVTVVLIALVLTAFLSISNNRQRQEDGTEKCQQLIELTGAKQYINEYPNCWIKVGEEITRLHP